MRSLLSCDVLSMSKHASGCDAGEIVFVKFGLISLLRSMTVFSSRSEKCVAS